MDVTGLDVNGALYQQPPPLEGQLQAILNLVPTYAWYFLPSGALTFVNGRTADFLGLPRMILSVSVQSPARIGTPTSLFCIRMIAKRYAESGRTVYAQAAPVR
jgi:hypothetical protein